MPAFRARYNYSIESISWAKIYLAEVVEKVLVDLLQVKNFLVTAADIVAEHEAGELRATIRLPSPRAVSVAEDEKADVVTNIPFVALLRLSAPKKSRIAPEPILLPSAYRLAWR